ncbi:unnamed protein product [Effrenium voratum]|uniref:FYVE-type domain-containing protein n=1 Tax=Effrenium voratum TaxID=2562239 RepID=A0AA36NJA4_9DINO|nr:unnamed protein product [Effrenium voratum]
MGAACSAIYAQRLSMSSAALAGLCWNTGSRRKCQVLVGVSLLLATGTHFALSRPPSLLMQERRRMLHLPKDYVGKGYDLVDLVAGDEVRLKFMLDSGLTTSMLLPSKAEELGLAERSGSGRQAVLDDVLLGSVQIGPLRPMVMDFPQSVIGASLGHPIDGMLGMEFFDRFAVGLGPELHLYEADCGERVAALAKMVCLTTAPLPARLLGLYLSVPLSDVRVKGVIDTGASFTVLNWRAAHVLLGIVKEDKDKMLQRGGVSSIDSSGNPLLMPLAHAALQLRGAGRKPPGCWAPKPVEVAIGDVASFKTIFNVDEPLALIGQDILTQRPTLLAARQRLLCFGGDGKKTLGTLNLGALETAASQHNLQVLDLKDHKISAIPKEVLSAFTHVKVLDLRKNALEELLPEISLMHQLEDLLLDQNRLRELPDEVCSLPNLRALSLSQNLLKALPKAVGSMKSLKSLSLGDNFVEEIPAELGQCKELQTLYLHHNSFTSLPSSLALLENLHELALEWFRYTTPPLPRVIKGAEWQRIITKLRELCRDKKDGRLTCIEVLGEFSQKAFDPNAIDSKRRTRLHVACLEGHVGVALALAETGSKCDSLDCEGYSPLLVAVREEHPDIANALVRVGVDVNRGGGLFGSPLHVATVNFDPQMVMLLIRGKADVNQTDADGNSPLHVLMSVFDKGGKRAAAIGKILLQHNADCNMMNSDKWAPLHLAARRGQLRGIAFVLSNLDSADAACHKGACSHVTAKSKGSRVRTCSRAFDLNLRGGSHLWTPLHLAGHACHVNVVQVLIEAGSDVFLRNVDGRTARHVSRGNLAISKLLRKAEDEWLWYRIHQGFSDMKETAKPMGDVSAATEPAPDVASSPRGKSRDTHELLETFKVDDDDDDPIEEIAKNIEGPSRRGGGPAAPKGLPDPGSRAAPQLRTASRPKMQRITEKCQDSYFSKEELQALQATNFGKPAEGEGVKVFIETLRKLQTGPKQRIPYFMSKRWVKELIPQVLEDETYHNVLLDPELVCNEDFLRLLISNVPQDRLTIFGRMRNSDQDSLLHIICKGARSGADLLSFLLMACPKTAFDLEAKDLRGQTSLHLAAQCGELGLVQVLLDNKAQPNAQEDTTGWTPLHFAVSKSHYSIILQLLQHSETDVNQMDKFEWPPILEACSRLDARATSLLVNGKANLSFRNQHQFDVLKAVDTSKKDLAAKRWMSCLVVSNGFRFQESTVQLTAEDRETLQREYGFFSSRPVPATHPPFFVPDHLAPRCHSCKVLFSVTVRRYHCRSCGLVLCGNCFKWRGIIIVPLDERVFAKAPLNESRLTAAVEMSLGRDKGTAPQSQPAKGYAGQAVTEEAAAKPSDGKAHVPLEGGLHRERGGGVTPISPLSGHAQMVRLCGPCCTFFEAGVGETYSMQRFKGGQSSSNGARSRQL